MVLSPNTTHSILTLSRYIDNVATHHCLLLNFREIRFILDVIKNVEVGTRGTTNGGNILTVGSYVGKHTKKFFIEQVNGKRTTTYGCNYSKVQILERALGMCWLVMNIRHVMKLPDFELATKTTIMVLDFFVHRELRGHLCMETCCLAQRDYRGLPAYSLYDLPQCQVVIVRRILTESNLKLQAFYTFVTKVLGVQLILPMCSDKSILESLMANILCKSHAGIDLEETKTIPRDLVAFLFALSGI